MTATDTITGSQAIPSPRAAASFTVCRRHDHRGHLTVTAKDAYGTSTDYTGTVHFASTDGAATLPADYTLPPATWASTPSRH